MNDDDEDDFWTTYIAATPEEDADFHPVVWLVALICAGFISGGLLIQWLH
jgi:hypothetical protein